MYELLGCLLFAIADYSSAVMLDFWLEYLDDSKNNHNRIQVSHRFANGIGFFVEGKFNSGGNTSDKPFSDSVDNDSEYSINYMHKLSSEFIIQPGLEIETTSSKSIYNPYLRSWYIFPSGIYLSARYRYEYAKDTSMGNKDEYINRGGIWLGYRWNELPPGTNYVYRSSDKI